MDSRLNTLADADKTRALVAINQVALCLPGNPWDTSWRKRSATARGFSSLSTVARAVFFLTI